MSTKKKILVIEDESTLRKALNDVLQQNGFEVLSATDGQMGLEIAKTEDLDLILLDIILPKTNGFEVLAQLKADDKDTPVVILTNLSDVNNVQKALDLGATTYLVKADFHLDEILAKIKEILHM